ncbi:Hypothetical predicted protein [Mytilus galloprovincialis]|uniref:TIR domain-containing protein n=1 Tax=Mytilus galloprovincialis TaxID=29158 RepID=A0A8B6F1M6_MYTGA|nr:Hypothetical predicted protein [Mytilus galloprovincialis]
MIIKAFLLLSILFKIVSSDISCSTEPKCRCILLEDGIYADCSGRQLNLSPTFKENVTSINLSFNYLIYPPSNENLPECLKNLNVSNNLIYTLSFDTEKILFWKITGLEFLDLSSNKLLIDEPFFFPNIFSNFTLLELLDISGNVIPEKGFPEFDNVMAPLISLRFLSVDIFESITFGRSFERLSNLKSLRLTGVCNTSRTFIIMEDFFLYLSFLEYLDISTLEVWTSMYNDTGSTCYCSLTSIHRGAIGKLTNLKYLDISNNRYLGLCGFRNITYGLNLTSIKIFKARNLYCQDSRSVTLYCDDIRNLRNTSLEELYIDGNNIDIGQPGILTYLPSSLLILSIRDVTCEKSRINTVSGDNTTGTCAYTPQHYNDYIHSSKPVDVPDNPDPWRCSYPLGDVDVHYIVVPENVKSIVMNNSRMGWKIKYWYYIAKRNYFQYDYMRLEERQNYKFDVFLSYADEERIFAIMELTKRLEENENFRLCIHERDFIPGCDIADNIVNAIHNSRKVIFVVTPAFLKSKWCIYELNMAYMEYVVSRQGVNCMIMVIKEKIKERDIPRKMYDIMKDESYLTFPDEEEDKEAFWERLIDSLR